MAIAEDTVREALKQVIDPELFGWMAIEALSVITASTAASEEGSVGAVEGWSWLANMSRARVVLVS